ncbi:MAG: hypothetical protein JXQ82_07630 [Methanomicrobiaceae archaeon]|nr:hypothetical protein [Methanomicrobiaceae archaeon]
MYFNALISNLVIGIIAGIVAALFTASLVHSIQVKKQFNTLVKQMLVEIEQNKHKFETNFEGDFCIAQKKWLADFKNKNKKESHWIPNKYITEGYGGYLYNYLNFFYFSLLEKSLLIMYLPKDDQYQLNSLYYSMKYFCAVTQKYEEEINKLITASIGDNTEGEQINYEKKIKFFFSLIENERNNLIDIFKGQLEYNSKYYQNLRMSYFKSLNSYINK